MNLVAVIEIVVVSFMLMLPTSPFGAPWRDGFDWAGGNVFGGGALSFDSFASATERVE